MHRVLGLRGTFSAGTIWIVTLAWILALVVAVRWLYRVDGRPLSSGAGAAASLLFLVASVPATLPEFSIHAVSLLGRQLLRQLLLASACTVALAVILGVDKALVPAAAAIFVGAAVEEVVFRALLPRRLANIATERFWRADVGGFVALVGAQALFALCHIITDVRAPSRSLLSGGHSL